MARVPVLARCPLAGPFASATAVQPAAAGEWLASIDAGWEIAGNANGGYLLAMATRALTGATGRPDPVTVTAHYLSPGQAGARPYRHPDHQGGEALRHRRPRRCSQVPARCWPCSGRSAICRDAEGPELVEGAPPDLPAPGATASRVHAAGTFPPPFMGQVDLRLHPDDAAFAAGQPIRAAADARLVPASGTPSLSTPSPCLCAVDAFPPTAFNARLPIAWTPTVELTAHIRATAGAWLAPLPLCDPVRLRPVSSKRTARSGTAPGAWWVSRASSPSSPGAEVRRVPRRSVRRAGAARP